MVRFWRLLKSLTKLRWKILPPRHTNVLLYFITGADVIAPYFSKTEFQMLDLREHEVNISVALRCVLDKNLSAEHYAIRYIELVKPKLIITFIDNFPAFFRLKQHFPETRTMLIQNGMRSDRGDLFGELLEDLTSGLNHVDQMFVFGPAIGAIYSKFISGTIVPIGSFKNNLVKVQKRDTKSVAYISTYRSEISEQHIVQNSSPSRPTTYGEVIRRREQVIIFLANYCKANKLELVIIGKDDDFERERSHYATLLKNYSWTISQRSASTSSYEAIDNSEIIVFTSSTLGYEALARGKKTATFLIDSEFLDAPALKFGWPAVLPSEGLFWTHQFSETRFMEIMDYLVEVPNLAWEKVRSETMHDIIHYDEGNSQFVAAIQELRVNW